MALKLSRLLGAIGGDIRWEVVSSNTTAAPGSGYLVDCSGNTITVTLPSSPAIGNQVAIKDFTGNANSNNITVNRNGRKIEGSDSDLIIDRNYYSAEFVYTGSSRGWVGVSVSST